MDLFILSMCVSNVMLCFLEMGLMVVWSGGMYTKYDYNKSVPSYSDLQQKYMA